MNETVDDYEVSPEFAQLLRRAEQMLSKMGLDLKFVYDLSDGEDWGFILKCLSILEAAMGEVILDRCFNNKYALPRDENELSKIVAKMSLEGGTGKLAFLRAFSLLSKETVTFVRTLNSVRNRYAHDIRLNTMRLEEVVDGDTIRSLVRVRGIYDATTTPQQLRFFISFGVLSVLWELHFRAEPKPTILTGGLSTM
ncbi:hypothetical protein [Neorhizobium sp. NCHU2750]|uniref:hypothetical protein n=1 Tax=Neorhizobium sp. NCHU2750 TaxID=1825976 RepID=UPI000E730706|nr:hypothetical protein NCHU2750_33090 [Neorhizobium sp. NCHU2750]